jgi:hypothetical protein
MQEILRFGQHGFNTAVLDVEVIGKDGRYTAMSGPGQAATARGEKWLEPTQ